MAAKWAPRQNALQTFLAVSSFPCWGEQPRSLWPTTTRSLCPIQRSTRAAEGSLFDSVCAVCQRADLPGRASNECREKSAQALAFSLPSLFSGAKAQATLTEATDHMVDVLKKFWPRCGKSHIDTFFVAQACCSILRSQVTPGGEAKNAPSQQENAASLCEAASVVWLFGGSNNGHEGTH